MWPFEDVALLLKENTPMILGKRKMIVIKALLFLAFYPNVIVPVLLQPAKPLHSFDRLCLKLKLVSCSLACCIGGTITAADSIATAASTAIITIVELSMLSSFEDLH